MWVDASLKLNSNSSYAEGNELETKQVPVACGEDEWVCARPTKTEI